MMCLKYMIPVLLWTCCSSQNVCEEPPEVDFGEMVSEERAVYQERDRVQYSCYPGHTLEGSEWITCEGSKWTPPPKCLAPCSITKQQLDAKNLLLSGGRRRSLVIQNNQMLEFLCREGYVLSAPSVRKCIDGHMDLPSCISEGGKNCSRPPTLEKGDMISLSQEQYTSGSSVEFRCQQYYAMEGYSRSFCDNGNWTKVPACLEPCVISLTELERLKMSVKLRSDENELQTLYRQHGDAVEFSCKPGYALATNPPQSDFDIQCRGGPIVYPECKAIRCDPPRLANGTFRPQRTVYQDGDLIMIECDNRLQTAEGQRIAECTRNGWSPPPQCTCGEPPTVHNADIVSGRADVYKPYHRVQYRCHEGFRMYGSASVTCEIKVWSEPPTCKIAEENCGRPPSVPNGDILNFTQAHYEPGTRLQYKCQHLYVMNGPSEIHCENGHWTEAPTCIEACTVTTEDMERNHIQLKWRSDPKLYSESGDTMEFVCARYYRKDPSSPPFRVKCIEGKVEYPRCIPIY